MKRSSNLDAIAAWAAVLLCVLAVAGFGAALDGYSQRLHPVAMPGARGMPHAVAFGLLAFVLPGLLAVLVAARLRVRLPASAGWAPRIGAGLVLLSAVAFALQGVFPLDPRELDAGLSRLHASAWTAWWIAYVPGAVLLAIGCLRSTGWRGFALVSIAAAALVGAFAMLALPLPAAVAQRVAFLAWLAWLPCAARAGRLSGSAA